MRTKKIGLAILVGAVILVLTWTVIQGKPSGGKDNGRPPEIERGVFVDYGYGSPPWYPPQQQTDSYRWAPAIRWAASNPQVGCTVYTAGRPTGTFAAVSQAFAEWDGYTSADLYGTVGEDSTSTPPLPGLDAENTMSWRAIDGPGGIVAVCYYWYYTNTKELVEFDIVFDRNDPWSAEGAADCFDVQNIATHELGHTLVLQDLRSPRDGALTMHAYTWLGDTDKRSLGSGDILGVQAIYGQ